MDRCKLEYMIKAFDFKEKKRIIQEMDPYGDYFFKKDLSRFLVDPNTTDVEILKYVGPYSLLYYVVLDAGIEDAALYRGNMEKEVEEVIASAIAQYKLINQICIENNAIPFFKDPTNVSECEKTRLDIVKIIPEEILNVFFGVESIRDYDPPKYNINN